MLLTKEEFGANWRVRLGDERRENELSYEVRA